MTDASDSDRRGRLVLLGHIAGAHGVRGAVLVKSYTAEPAAIGDYGDLADEAGVTRFALTVEGATAKGLICRIGGIGDRTQAEKLKGTGLYIPRDRLPAAEDGSYYHADLVGLSVVTEDGRALGAVSAVVNYGAGDILEVEAEGAKRTLLYPMTEAVVRRVDLDAGVVVLAPPDEVDAGDQAAAAEGEDADNDT
jgi:16S rRNA processing protein RimM